MYTSGTTTKPSASESSSTFAILFGVAYSVIADDSRLYGNPLDRAKSRWIFSPRGRSDASSQRFLAVAVIPRMSATSVASYGVPSLLKMSWNQTAGSAVYSRSQESHG